MVTLHETEVDGVRCFWVETGRPTLAALLVFRYGMADEPLNESGWQHLLEHLALHGSGAGALHTNGSVTLLETMFDAHGPADAVRNHLGQLTSRLSKPDFAELNRERDVLRAEADVRGSSITGRALGWRYGATGPGVVAYSDAALGRATEDALAARAARAFTRGNGVLMLDGPPPRGLTLTLPEGELAALRRALPCPQPTPAAYEEGSGLALSGVVSRGAATAVAAELMRLALADHFRHEAGTAYAPWVTYERVDADSAVLIAGSDVQPAGRPTLVEDAIGIVHDLAERGPDASRLSESTASYVQSISDPYATFGVATRAGIAHLHGKPQKTIDEMINEMESVDSAGVHECFREVRRTLLLGVPHDAPVGTRLPVLQFENVTSYSDGRRFRHRNWPAVTDRLVVHDSKVELRSQGDSRIAPFRELAGVFAFQDGARHLVRVDGYGVTVDPEQWHRGDEAVAELDRLVPQALRMPHPARQGQGPPRLSWWSRWRRGLSRSAIHGLLSTPMLFAIVVTIWIGGYVAIFSFGVNGVGLPWTILGGAAIVGLVRGDDGDT